MTVTGTEALLRLADELAEAVEHVRGGYHLSHAAALMESAADALKRLAQFEPDIEVGQGEN